MGGCVCIFVYTLACERGLFSRAMLKYESYLKISAFEDDSFRQLETVY